ncbi:MAG TPA: hypothetical protein VM165_05520 [Planctomycetaceae bacterium]|nr:hypothetical protein [Planctomycetaceae bacterium]
MTTVHEFRQVYTALAHRLDCDPFGSAQYCRMLSEWEQAGSPRPIDLFIIVRAYPTRDIDDDLGGSEEETILDLVEAVA